MQFSVFEGQKQDECAPEDKDQGGVDVDLDVRCIFYKTIGPATKDIGNEWTNKPKNVDHKLQLDEFLGVLELPVDDLLDSVVLEEVQVLSIVIDQIGQEQVVNTVEVLGRFLNPVQILCKSDCVGGTTHVKIDLDLRDQRYEVHESVFDFRGYFLLTPTAFPLIFFNFVGVAIVNDVILDLFLHLEEAFEV